MPTYGATRLDLTLQPISGKALPEVAIDKNEKARAVVEEVLNEAKVVVDPFHVIQNANRRLDETRRLEQQLRHREIKKSSFLWVRKGSQRKTGSIWRDLQANSQSQGDLVGQGTVAVYQAKDRAEGEKILERVLIACQTSEDVEMVRWGRTLRRWRKYLLNYFEHRTTNAYTEGGHTKIKLLKRASYGLRNIEVYVEKMHLGFLPPFLLYLHHTLTVCPCLI